MSAIESPIEEARDDVLVREFDASLSAGDGRNIDIRIVPFGERATVYDGHGGLPKGQPYQEEWMRGCFTGQLNAAHRIYLNFQHEPGLRGIVGKGTALREEADGYYGSFRMLSGDDSDKALELVREDVLTSASIEVPIHTIKSVRTREGIVQRVKGHLSAVALCRIGAFAGASVLAVREQEILMDEELLPPKMDEEILDRCRRLGIVIPEQLRNDDEDND